MLKLTLKLCVYLCVYLSNVAVLCVATGDGRTDQSHSDCSRAHAETGQNETFSSVTLVLLMGRHTELRERDNTGLGKCHQSEREAKVIREEREWLGKRRVDTFKERAHGGANLVTTEGGGRQHQMMEDAAGHRP